MQHNVVTDLVLKFTELNKNLYSGICSVTTAWIRRNNVLVMVELIIVVVVDRVGHLSGI